MIIESFIYVHKVCNSLVECCNTGKLDNSFQDDFRGKFVDRWKSFISHVLSWITSNGFSITNWKIKKWLLRLEGAIDYFEGESILHDCSIFDMKNSPADSILMVLNHEGKWFEVSEQYNCNLFILNIYQ